MKGSISIPFKFSFNKHSPIFCSRLLGLSQKRHWELKGPVWILGYLIILVYLYWLSLLDILISLEEVRTYLELVADWAVTMGPYWVLMRLLATLLSWEELGPKDYLFFIESVKLLPKLFCFLSYIISLSIFWEICLSWSESYCLFLFIVPSSYLLTWLECIIGAFSDAAKLERSTLILFLSTLIEFRSIRCLLALSSLDFSSFSLRFVKADFEFYVWLWS